MLDVLHLIGCQHCQVTVIIDRTLTLTPCVVCYDSILSVSVLLLLLLLSAAAGAT